ncbi:hypothetical protein D3C75_1285850 [compost metagenome]
MISTSGPVVKSILKAAPIIARQRVINEVPVRSSAFLPTLSMSHTEIIVNSTLISPIQMVCVREASVPSPIPLNISGA